MAELILFRVAANLFLYRLDDVWVFFPESLEIEVLDILAQWHLPWFLVVIVQLAQLFGIHSQFAGHLDLGMGQTVLLPSINPRLHSVVGLPTLSCHFIH